jgi:succinyl-diaminopimelate desuccinylase
MLLTSDEEGPAVDGTVAVVEALAAREEAIDFCLVGEPTCVEQLGDTVKIGRRGSLSGHMIVEGVQGHVAYPHLALNPIHEVAAAIDELATTRWDDGSDDFQPTSFQISNIHAGTGAGNVIPGRCEIDFNLRFAPVSTPESLRRQIEAILYSHELEFQVEWTVGAKPFQCAAGVLAQSLGEAIEEVTSVRVTRSTTGGTSDGRYIAKVCPQVAEFGPVNASIHKIDECVRIADIGALKEIYRRTLERVLLV